MTNTSEKYTYPLVETIRADNGQIHNLPYHQARMNRSCVALFGRTCPFDLHEILAGLTLPSAGRHKIRFLYGPDDFRVEMHPYSPRPVRRLKLVEASHIDYSHKYTDRSALEALLRQRGPADDILMVRNGKITDTSFTNIAFFDGRRWLTPAQPLLPGTARRFLMDNQIIFPADITVNDFSRFKYFKIFNALLPFDEQPSLPVQNIIP